MSERYRHKEECLVVWVNAKETDPPVIFNTAICKMYLISNDGFVTVGFWYPKNKKWLDANHKVNITEQVRFWMELPKSPNW